ncbi:MAG: cytochrome c [Planctomycetaceae bacterium]
MAVLLLPMAGCGKPSPEDRYVRPDVQTSFSILFGKNCSGCHGMDGQLGPAPPLNDAVFQAIISDEQIHDLIAKGRNGTHMPAFDRSEGGKLTAEQVTILAQGIREEWAGRKPDIAKLPAYAVSVDDPAGMSMADVVAGKTVFAKACAKCHGVGGEGKSAGAINSYALGRLTSDQLLRRIVITGREDLGMPNFVDSGKMSPLLRPLEEQEIIDVVAYVRELQFGREDAVATDEDERNGGGNEVTAGKVTAGSNASTK